jgi:hypothetical protein
VDPVVTDAIQDVVAPQQLADPWLDPGKRRVMPARSVSSRISRSFADPCESMKSMPSQSSTIPVTPGADNATSRIR